MKVKNSNSFIYVLLFWRRQKRARRANDIEKEKQSLSIIGSWFEIGFKLKLHLGPRREFGSRKKNPWIG